MHLSGLQRELHVPEHLHPAERLVDVLRCEQFNHGEPSFARAERAGVGWPGCTRVRWSRPGPDYCLNFSYFATVSFMTSACGVAITFGSFWPAIRRTATSTATSPVRIGNESTVPLSSPFLMLS